MADSERTVSFILKARNDASKALAEAQAQVNTLSKDMDQLKAAVDRYNNADTKADRLNSTIEAQRARTKLDAIAAAEKKRDDLALALAERELAVAIDMTTTAQERAAKKAAQLRTTRMTLVNGYGEESTQVRDLDIAIQRLTSTQDRAYASVKRMGAGMMNATEQMALSKVGGGNGLRNSAVYNLSYQINDVITGLMSGQAPMMILAQQGGQIFQIFQTANMSVADFGQGLLTLGSRALRVVGPLAAVVAVFSPFIAALIQMKQEEKALESFGKNLSIMADGGEHSARAMKDAAVGMREFGISMSDATKFVQDMANSGIRDDKMIALARAAKDLADVTGMKLSDAMVKVTGAFTGGFDALRKFDQQVNIFTASQMAQIRALYDAGRAADGQQLALDMMSSALGKTESQTITLTQAWNHLVDVIQATGVPKVLAVGLAIIAEDIQGLIDLADVTARALTTDEAERLTEVQRRLGDLALSISDARKQAMSGDLSNGGKMFLTADLEEQNGLLKEQADLQAKLGQKANGVTSEQAQANLKLQQDLTASIQAQSKADADNRSSMSMSAQQLAVRTALLSAENDAEKLGIDLKANGSRLTAEQTAAITANAQANFLATSAQNELNASKQLANSFIQQEMSAEQKRKLTIDQMVVAIGSLTRAYGANSGIVIAAQAALDRFKGETDRTIVSVGALVNKALQLRDALASFGGMSFDLDRRLTRARNELAQIASGAPETSVDAESFVQGELDKLRAAGASADALATKYQELKPKADAVYKAEKEAADLKSKTYSDSKGGGGGGGGGGGSGLSSGEKDSLRDVNNLYAQRKMLLKEIDLAQKTGDTSKVDTLRAQMEALNASTLKAVDASIAYYQTLSGPQADAAIIKLQKIKDEIGGSADKIKTQFLPTAESMNEKLSDIASDGAKAFSEALANGENAGEALWGALRKGIAQFLIDLGAAIVKQAIFNAISGGAGGGGTGGVGGAIAGAIGKLFHDGGMVDGAAPTRMVSPTVFAGAQRYHNGGLVGLRPGEVPAILKDDEEVLTRRDARHARNGGGMRPIVKVVNVLDSSDILDAAVSSVAGEQVVLNFMSRRSNAVKGAIGG